MVLAFGFDRTIAMDSDGALPTPAWPLVISKLPIGDGKLPGGHPCKPECVQDGDTYTLRVATSNTDFLADGPAILLASLRDVSFSCSLSLP